MSQKFKNFHLIKHPVVHDRLSRIRREETGTEDFRRLLKEIGMLMAYEVTKDLKITTQKIKTPMTEMDAPVLANKEPIIIPILRAGLGLSDGLKEVLGAATFGHIGVYRDEETHLPVEYLVKLPKDIKDRDVILVDPMLATGNSAKFALDILVREGVPSEKIRFMVLVAAPEGVELLEQSHPNVAIYSAALDSHLDKNCFIVPGLGDAGDRLFGTV